ncbi:MAG: hypothetical protein IT366_07355 [Candidatus Hydrogenedentes bacterium]|nr:hypothetical protein [Candidatus Hydrogenedentota bacterium]
MNKSPRASVCFRLLVVALAVASAQTTIAQAPASVQLVPIFDAKQFQDPEAALWPAYFWLWNAPLDRQELRAQLRDMNVHGAKSVCMLPMPHAFRPDSTNNGLEPDYLTPEYFERVKFAVDEAAQLGMNWWLYDEGGWPSGQALGKVTEGHPELARRAVVREKVTTEKPFVVPSDAISIVVESPEKKVVLPGETWTPATPDDVAYLYKFAQGGPADLLNASAVARFIAITHDAYANAIADHFGKTVRFTFTDEPAVAMPRPPGHFSWFEGIDARYNALSTRSFAEDLPQFFIEPTPEISLSTARARVDLYDATSKQFADAYFVGLKNWGRAHGLASGGHLGGEDETFGAVKHGFGHVMRPLRAMDVPGVDLIWRQVFPGRENQSNFPAYAASAAHQNGTRFSFTESFCVYGNGLTPAQMKWLVDYQYIRGINLSVFGCYPLTTRDHHMTGERPHFGPMNPQWNHLNGLHAYVARLGYALSVGKPLVRTALYYPVRDMWALGTNATEAANSFDALAMELLARQCAYDIIDDDVLSTARVDGKELIVGAMRYDTVVCGATMWMHPASRERLDQFADSGGNVMCAQHAPGVNGELPKGGSNAMRTGVIEDIAADALPIAIVAPASRSIRVAARELEGQQVLAVFNEGNEPYVGHVAANAPHVTELDLMTGRILNLPADAEGIALKLDAGESRVYLLSQSELPEAAPALQPLERISVAPESMRAVAGRQVVVGEHDFEFVDRDFDETAFAQSSDWTGWLTDDYSGDVEYRFDFEVPGSWAGSALQLETGPIEYAATVSVDGIVAGTMLWSPWRIALLPCSAGKHTITIRVANSLANELTSERVTEEWAKKSGPGWPSPYHKRAIEFEKESRGGGITGPIRIYRLTEG